jgi:hypothetical protein
VQLDDEKSSPVEDLLPYLHPYYAVVFASFSGELPSFSALAVVEVLIDDHAHVGLFYRYR